MNPHETVGTEQKKTPKGTIVALAKRGFGVALIHEQLPHLTVEQIEAVLKEANPQ